MRSRILFLSITSLFSLLISFGCAKDTRLEGKIVDRDGKPLVGVKVTAQQVQPIKGFELVEAVTKGDGVFSLRNVFPNSDYVMFFRYDKWDQVPTVRLTYEATKLTAVLDKRGWIEKGVVERTGPEGFTKLLASPLILEPIRSTIAGKLVDREGNPLPNVKVFADKALGDKLRPLEGYMHLGTQTGNDGSFRLDNVFPDSQYDLFFWSDNWKDIPSMTLSYGALERRGPSAFGGWLDKELEPQAYFNKSGWLGKEKISIRTPPQAQTKILPSDVFINHTMPTIFEGRIIDGKGQPFKNIRVIASKKGQRNDAYDTCEAVADSNGTFRLEKLFPKSDYMLSFDGGDWTFEIPAIKMGGEEATVIMEKPITVAAKIFKKEAVFIDTQTDLMWSKKNAFMNLESALSTISEFRLNRCGGCRDWRFPSDDEITQVRDSLAWLLPPILKRARIWSMPQRYQAAEPSIFIFSEGKSSPSHRSASAEMVAVCPMN